MDDSPSRTQELAELKYLEDILTLVRLLVGLYPCRCEPVSVGERVVYQRCQLANGSPFVDPWGA